MTIRLRPDADPNPQTYEQIMAEVEKAGKKCRLPLAVLPNKRKCCCTPTTCTCKKPVDTLPRSGKLKGK